MHIINIKKPDAFSKAARFGKSKFSSLQPGGLIQDPWLSVPASQQVWPYFYACLYTLFREGCQFIPDILSDPNKDIPAFSIAEMPEDRVVITGKARIKGLKG